MRKIFIVSLLGWIILGTNWVFAKVSVIATQELAAIEISQGLPLNQPSDVEVGAKGKVYLLDGVNNRVLIFSSTLDYIGQFGRKGHDPGELWFPMGLTCDRRGNVYVADAGNHRVNVYNEQGTFQSAFDLAWEAPLLPTDPTDLVIDDEAGNCYIVDNDNHRILVYSIEGKFSFQWGFKGQRKGEFRYPFSIARDKERNLYIVDVINARVQVFNPKGEFLRQIGSWGITPGTFYRPKGVTLDGENQVYVSGSYVGYGNVQVFSKEGEFMGVIGSSDKKAMKFNTPVGLFLDNDTHRLFVVEMKANRLRVLRVP